MLGSVLDENRLKREEEGIWAREKSDLEDVLWDGLLGTDDFFAPAKTLQFADNSALSWLEKNVSISAKRVCQVIVVDDLGKPSR